MKIVFRILAAVGLLAISIYVGILIGAHRPLVFTVEKEFNTPGAIIAVYTNSSDAKSAGDKLIAKASAYLDGKGYSTQSWEWTWDYYKVKNVVWHRILSIRESPDGDITGSFECYVVQALASNTWALTWAPFPIGPANICASKEARELIFNVISPIEDE
jgi:hypothetical protein